MSIPAARPLFDKSKIYFTVGSTEDCKFQYRGKVFEIELPEEVNKGDQVVCTINTETNKVSYVRTIHKSGELRKSKRSSKRNLKRTKRRNTRRR